MKEFKVIPELNYWMRIILNNSPVNDVYHKHPVPVSNFWREPNSIIELLFNENFNPGTPWWLQSSSSSSSELTSINEIYSSNDRRFIYVYRRCNLKSITDKVFLSRIQIYRWNANVFVANSEKFIDEMDMTGSLYDSTPTQDRMSLPYDVPEEQRSKYITYTTKQYFSSNYPLVKVDKNLKIEPPTEQPIFTEDENLFDLTNQDLDMLDLLYDYKVGYPVDISNISFSSLQTCISKLVYIYLDAMLNDSYTYYNNTTTSSDGILCSLYEKHVLDTLYILKQKLYCVNWNETVIINEKEKRYDEDMLMKLKKLVMTVTVSSDDVATSEIIILEDNLPWHRKDFTIYKDGKILEQDVDFTIVIDKSNVRDPFIRVKFLKAKLVFNEVLRMMWSYVDPYSAWSEIDV